ncbi:protein kinase-like domain, concanavalin A-like lectin/glucanase domain protein [Tanacetum coccineum]
MVGQFLKKQDYIDLELPINVMSKLNYYWIMSEGLKSRRKPSNPKKISNFVGRVKGLKVFMGNFTYECDFVVVEDTTSVIDHYLGGMVLGKPFVKEFGHVYDKDEGKVTFEKEKENITFKMPDKMESFKRIDRELDAFVEYQSVMIYKDPPCITTFDVVHLKWGDARIILDVAGAIIKDINSCSICIFIKKKMKKSGCN